MAASRRRGAKAKVAVQGVTPFLWFDGEAEEAARFYVSLIKGSKITSADPMSVRFELAGREFFALNGGPQYKLTPAFSIFVSVRTQRQVDLLWNALSKGGTKMPCGWLEDRFGVSWQIIPERLMELLGHEDREVAARAAGAMFRMTKIDIKALDRAARGATGRGGARAGGAARRRKAYGRPHGSAAP